MRKLLATIVLTNLCAAGVALADDPTPAPVPAPPAPDAPPPPPEEKPAEKPAEEKPAEPPKVESKPPPSTGAPATSEPAVFEGVSASSNTDVSEKTKNPKLAIELSGSGGQLADPYIVYKGWTLENGATKGTRLEGQLGGIMLAYELTAMGNTKACSGDAGCLSGDFGSTTFHSLEIGYRYRMGMLGPIRPFITASLGGVRSNAGDWAMQSGSGFGGVVRAAFGVEIPFAGRFFASGALGYRLFITQNPYRSATGDTVNTIFIGAEKPNGDYVDDAHIVGVNLGVGVSL